MKDQNPFRCYSRFFFVEIIKIYLCNELLLYKELVYRWTQFCIVAFYRLRGSLM
uniref:Uncharacterized protein n=1 Tax=Monilinia fructicola TaxID=38448 RepID=A0A889XPW1_MONFR|nr:hypothetical protein KQ509_mgp26 [Monilinia fructicola]QRF72239.1 hypothetical protein [Monilinia fructicola]